MVRITRRELGGLVGSAFLLAACGGSKGSAPSGRPPTTALTGAGGELPVATLRGTTVSAGQQVSVADARRYAGLLNGVWRGGWHDSTKRSGTSVVSAQVNPTSRTAVIDVACSGAILGVPVQSERYTVDLAGFRRLAPQWNVVSPQFGDLVAMAESGTDFAGTVTNVPHTSIKSIDVQATRVGTRVDLRYQINPANGPPVNGTMAWAKGSTPAIPAALNAVATATPANIQSGAYAAGLLSAAEVSSAVGKRFAAPMSNGGRLFYANGVDVSDGLANSVDKSLVLQYSVYICHDSAIGKKFWKGESANATSSIHGPWRDAFYQIGTLYAFDGLHVTTVNVVSLHGTQSAAAIEHAAIDITKSLMARLKH
jgi:hypothetical protein